MHKLLTIIFVFASCFAISQKALRDINPFPFDSSIVDIQKVESNNTINSIIQHIPIDKAELLFVGEYHKWKDNTDFYKKILDNLSNSRHVVCFEMSVIYQQTLDTYLRTGDSLIFKKNMLYLNSNIDKTLFQNRISFFIGLKNYSANPNFKFYTVDQYSGADEYLKSLHLILSNYKSNKSIKRFDDEIKKLIKTYHKSNVKTFQDSITYNAVSDTAGLFKLLTDNDKEYYKLVVSAFAKCQKSNVSLFKLEIIRENFLIQKIFEKSDSLKIKTVLFCGQSHASYSKYVDNFSKKPSVRYIANYFKNAYPGKSIINICFDVVNKIDSGIKLSPLAKIASQSQEFTNRFWQALTAKDSLMDFNLYTCKGNNIPFDYIILKKDGINLLDTEEYLTPKKSK